MTKKTALPPVDSGFRRRLFPVLVAVFALFSVALTVAYIDGQDELSPFDEWVYSDYVDKLTRLDLPQSGELVDEYALELSSCRGVFVWGPTGSPCGGPYLPEQYPQAGVTTGDLHPPTYFVVTTAGARALIAIGLTDDLLTAARLIGGLWLAGAMVLLYMLARELGAAEESAIAFAVVLAILPLTRYTNSYVTPDAANLAIGGAVALSAVLWDKKRLSSVAFVTVVFFAMATKPQNILVVLVAIGYVLLRGASETVEDISGDTGGRKRIPLVFGLVGAATIPILAWTAYRQLTAVGPVPDQGVGGPYGLSLLVNDSVAFVLRLGLGPTETGLPIPVYAHFLTWLLIAAGLGALIYRAFREPTTQLMAATAVILVIGGPLLITANWIVNDVAVASPTRYGGSLLPAWAAVAAAGFTERRRARWLLGGVLVIAVYVTWMAVVT